MKDLLHCFDWKTRVQQRVGAKGGKYQFIKIELQHQPYMVIDLTDDPEPEWAWMIDHLSVME